MVLMPWEQFVKAVLFSPNRWEICPKRFLNLTIEGTREMKKKKATTRNLEPLVPDITDFSLSCLSFRCSVDFTTSEGAECMKAF